MLFLCVSTAFAMEEVTKEDALAWARKIRSYYYPAVVLGNDQEEVKAYNVFKVLLSKQASENLTFEKAFQYCQGQGKSSNNFIYYFLIIRRYSNEVMQMAYRSDLEESDYDRAVGNCITSVSASRPRMSSIFACNDDMTIGQIQQKLKELTLEVNNATSVSEKIWHH